MPHKENDVVGLRLYKISLYLIKFIAVIQKCIQNKHSRKNPSFKAKDVDINKSILGRIV